MMTLQRTEKNAACIGRGGILVRRSGVLLPVFSIPSKYGIGSFSKEAYEFVDFLAQSGQTLWQILPLGPTSYGDSPYQALSTFAGNPYYIDLEALIDKGWLTREECEPHNAGEYNNYVNYGKLYNERFALLQKAYERSNLENDGQFFAFVEENAYWLKDYALYMAVKNSFAAKGWIEWDRDIKLRTPAALRTYRKNYAQEIEFYEFLQYLFFGQWSALKAYANGKGIQIIGDVPIYVAFDSADAWMHPELFWFDEECTPIAVAGCPPDAFAHDGQLWGNPLYRWDYHKKTGYAWWVKRIAYCTKLYDIVRIDHFRGFDEYYAIPYGSPTARTGRWEKGPGYDLFKVMKKKLGDAVLIAEDLGFLTPSVVELIQKTGYPGMRVLQFAFDGKAENAYLPHNCVQNSVIYTGTHDNETTAGWYAAMPDYGKAYVKRYLNIGAWQEESGQEMAWTLIRSALASTADMAVIPMQDYLGLDNNARINMPATLGRNWQWRLWPGQCTAQLAERIREMTKLYGR